MVFILTNQVFRRVLPVWIGYLGYASRYPFTAHASMGMVLPDWSTCAIKCRVEVWYGHADMSGSFLMRLSHKRARIILPGAFFFTLVMVLFP